MSTKTGVSTSIVAPEYESPELIVIGEAADVVLGFASGGFDGQFQMTESGFEFEPDDERQ